MFKDRVKTKDDSKPTDSYRQPYCDMAFIKRGCRKGANWFKTDDLPEGKFKTYLFDMQSLGQPINGFWACADFDAANSKGNFPPTWFGYDGALIHPGCGGSPDVYPVYNSYPGKDTLGKQQNKMWCCKNRYTEHGLSHGSHTPVGYTWYTCNDDTASTSDKCMAYPSKLPWM